MNYNIAAGMDNTTLNRIIAETYKAVYPEIFKSTIKIGQMGIKTVAFDMNIAPTVDFDETVDMTSYVEALLKEQNIGISNDALIPKYMPEAVRMVNAACLIIKAGADLTIKYNEGDPSDVHADLKIVIHVKTDVDEHGNWLTVQAVSGTVHTTNPPNPTLDALLNNALIPSMIPYLNENLLKPIKIPTLKYENITISLPVLVTQSPDFVAYSALGASQPDIPEPSSWPNKCVFTATDTKVLTKAAAIPFPIGQQQSFSYGPFGGIVEALVKAPTHIQVNSDGSLSASIAADALAQLTWKTPFGRISFGPRADASLAATFKVSVKNGDTYIVVESIPIPTFHFSWGIPSWINWLFVPLEQGLAAALNAILGPILGQLLKFPPIKIYTIPKISFTLGDKTITINVNEINTGSKNSMLLVDCKASIS